jgi:hypothetical protein
MLSGSRSRSGRETLQKPQADVKVTFGWFVRNRWLPLKEANWKEETARDKKCIIQMDLIGKFDNVPLENFDKFSLQVHLNDLAKTRSRDRVLQIRAYMRDIFAEAVDQDFLPKDPARKVKVPKQLAARTYRNSTHCVRLANAIEKRVAVPFSGSSYQSYRAVLLPKRE